MTDARISFEPIHPHQIPSLSAFHAKYLSGRLTQLGLPYIEYFYEIALALEGTFGLLAIDDGALAGFVFGSSVQNDVHDRVIRKKPKRWVGESLRAFMRHPLHSTQIAWSVLQRPSGNLQFDNPELHFIAVRPDLRGRGIGLRLFQDFAKDVAAKGKNHFGLSVPLNNPLAIRFYKTNGGVVLGDYKSAGMRLRRFVFNVKSV